MNRRYLANALRALSMDAIERAKSGHPGMPMGMADIAEVLWNDYLKHSPQNPGWVDRDRFVVSNGHGSMLLYSLLHLSGYALTLDEIKRFRQLDSATPGHPEFGETPGVEATTGPLGQGLANAVGMALAEKVLAARFNQEDFSIVDHHTYVFVGDGCLMEGISHEACSLAGTWGLGKLIVIYDDNRISIDGDVNGWFTDDTPNRFRAYGWEVLPEVDGHNTVQIKAAIELSRKSLDRPTLICCRTKIGWGAPGKEGSQACHGAPLGKEEVERTRENIGWFHPPFTIPKGVYRHWDAVEKGLQAETQWKSRFDRYRVRYPRLASEFERRMVRELPNYWDSFIQQTISEANSKAQSLATRKASQEALHACTQVLPELIGGSADLAESNLTLCANSKPITREDPNGNYIHFGVREFAMSAITNGLALHGGFIPFCATFLIFSEYARNALRMAALMKLPSIFVLTHDSVALGEDGPTHQPVEQIASLRLIPGMSVWRPADSVESTVAWQQAIEHPKGPTALIFSRQEVPHISRTEHQLRQIRFGAYVLRDCAIAPEAIVIATGSEVSIALQAWEALTEKGIQVRLISMPSTTVFDTQDEAYKEQLLPRHVTNRVVVEAGVSQGWQKYVGQEGRIISIDAFGKSAPGPVLQQHFGITVEAIVREVESCTRHRTGPKKRAKILQIV